MKGALFDRQLKRKWLDESLALATSGKEVEEQKSLLEVFLRDEITSETGRKKARTALARIWMDPPEMSRQLVSWALANQDGPTEPWHLGAMLATYPFFAEVVKVVNAALDQDPSVGTAFVYGRMRSAWGDREVVDVSVRSAVRTLREFGVLSGSPRSSKTSRGAAIVVPAQGPLFGWLGHAVLVARRQEEIEVSDLRRSPELSIFALPATVPNAYPLLEKFTEGGGRIILRVRGPKPAAPKKRTARQLSFTDDLSAVRK